MTPSLKPDARFARTARALNFSEICQMLAAFCKTEAGAKLCRSLTPVQSRLEAEKLLALTGEMSLLLKTGYILFPSLIDDPGPVLEKVKSGVLPEPEEVNTILSFQYQLERLKEFKTEFGSRAEKLMKIIEEIDPLQEMVDFFEMTFDGEGKVKPAATARLMELESRVNSLKKKISEKAEKLLIRKDIKNILQDLYITIRNDRIVLPIKAEYKNIFPGIIHGISATEHTAFMEPQELVKDNNNLHEAMSEKEEEIRLLLRKAAELLRENDEKIKRNYELMGELDCICAKARFSIKIGGNRPFYSDDDSIKVEDLRHPIMIIMGDNPRPNRIDMDTTERTFVVSGPNAGGKTVLLKSLGLFITLPSCGIFPPVGANSSIPFVKRVFAMVGDEQSIENGKSTFSAQLIGIKEAVDGARKGDWVIVDEILNGTDPQQASALALTVLEHLSRKGCRTFVSTHLPDLKLAAQQTNDMVNAAMGFGEDGKPNFRLEKGHPGVSYPLAIAASVGIPEEIIETARKRLSSSHDLYQAALQELQEKSEQMDKEITEYERLKKDTQKLEKELKQKLEVVKKQSEKFDQEKRKKLKEEVGKARTDLAVMLEKARNSEKKEKEKAALKLKKRENELVREIRKGESVPLEEVKEGGWVWIIPFDRKAKLVKMGSEDKVEVMAGGVRMTLSKSDILGMKGGEPEKKKPSWPVIPKKEGAGEAPPAEISLLGLTFEDSVNELEPFLDRHMMMNTGEIRVIHGKGVLKGKIEEYLKESPYVKSYRPAPLSQGGDGASIVTLS